MFFPERSYQIELAFCFLAFNRGRSVMEFHRTVKQRKLEIDRLITINYNASIMISE